MRPPTCFLWLPALNSTKKAQTLCDATGGIRTREEKSPIDLKSIPLDRLGHSDLCIVNGMFIELCEAAVCAKLPNGTKSIKHKNSRNRCAHARNFSSTKL